MADWTIDFDIAAEDYQNNPYPIWDELREQCPVATTERRGGAILPTTWETIMAAAYDTDHFSSRDVGVISPGR